MLDGERRVFNNGNGYHCSTYHVVFFTHNPPFLSCTVVFSILLVPSVVRCVSLVGLGLVVVLFATRRGGAVLFPRRGLEASLCANNNEERDAPGGAVCFACAISLSDI